MLDSDKQVQQTNQYLKYESTLFIVFQTILLAPCTSLSQSDC